MSGDPVIVGGYILSGDLALDFEKSKARSRCEPLRVYPQVVAEVVLAEIDVGPVVARAVRTHVREDIRAALAAGGNAVGEEIIEIRWGDNAFGQPVLDSRTAMIGIDDARALVFGALPDNAVSAEAVTRDGEPVRCTIGEGVWLVVLPDDPRQRYPVVFRDEHDAPINPGLPGDWERETVGEREHPCPACQTNAWDIVTAAWKGTGHLRNTRWGYTGGSRLDAEPGRAFVCRACGHEEKIGAVFGYCQS